MTESCTPAIPEPHATNPTELNNLRAAHSDELSSRTRATSIPADSCSLYDDEALGGTAGRATAWLALEHVGQWGRDVLDGSALGAKLSPALGEAVSQAGLKFLLIRQTGREGRVLHGAPDAAGNPTHWVLYALCTPGGEKLYSFSVSTPEQLLKLPLDNPQELIRATRSTDCGASDGYPARERSLGVLTYGRSPLRPGRHYVAHRLHLRSSLGAFGTGGVPISGESRYSVAARSAWAQHGYPGVEGGGGCRTPRTREKG